MFYNMDIYTRNIYLITYIESHIRIYNYMLCVSFGELPAEFYAISKEEIKREQQARTDAAERLGMLRTKAMRERDEMRELRKYR